MVAIVGGIGALHWPSALIVGGGLLVILAQGMDSNGTTES